MSDSPADALPAPAPDAPPALLEVRGAAFGYRGRALLSDVDLAVRPGLRVGIVGPNGSGKTTLFRGLLGLLRPLAGEVRRDARRIGYVPQREHLDPLFPLTTREVVRLGAAGGLRGLRRIDREARARADGALERVGLTAQAGEPLANLSGGQRQRALLARALMVRPDLLLLDEPTSGVDAGAARRLLDLLADLAHEDGVAVLMVSHQLGLLRGAVDEVWWVGGGRVRSGTPEELLAPERLETLLGSQAREDAR